MKVKTNDTANQLHWRHIFRVTALAMVSSGAAWSAECPADETYCQPIVACVPSTGESFRGFAVGLEEGKFFLQSGKSICGGLWQNGPDGTGAAIMNCEDDRNARATFEYFERETGTVVGKGEFDDGTVIEYWTGSNLAAYFERTDPADVQPISCHPTDLIS
ncbi:MAG: hypothetical protein AAFV38_02045 [Pseudomonadota bacterium]